MLCNDRNVKSRPSKRPFSLYIYIHSLQNLCAQLLLQCASHRPQHKKIYTSPEYIPFVYLRPKRGIMQRRNILISRARAVSGCAQSYLFLMCDSLFYIYARRVYVCIYVRLCCAWTPDNGLVKKIRTACTESFFL